MRPPPREEGRIISAMCTVVHRLRIRDLCLRFVKIANFTFFKFVYKFVHSTSDVSSRKSLQSITLKHFLNANSVEWSTPLLTQHGEKMQAIRIDFVIGCS